MTTITTNGAAVASSQVFSTPPLNVADGNTVIAWSRRSTTANPVKQEERYRSVIVSTAALAVPADACSSKFARLLQSTVNGLAEGMFQAWAKDNIQSTAYDGAAITVDNVLMHWAEQKQRETIDGAAVLTWLKASKTWADALETEARRNAWATMLPKIAAPSYRASFSPKEASVMIARIQEEDADTPVGLFVVQRLNTILGTADKSDAL